MTPKNVFRSVILLGIVALIYLNHLGVLKNTVNFNSLYLFGGIFVAALAAKAIRNYV